MEHSLQFTTALIIGLLGGTHCIGMCGGITGALSMAIPTGEGYRKRLWFTLLSYNAGRIFSYSLAGLIAGTFGWLLADQSSSVFIILRSFAACLLILMGIYIAGWGNGLTLLEKAGGGLWKLLQPLSKKVLPVKNLRGALLLGTLWGWLPCGLVYSTLVWSSMASSPLASASLMMAFGIGTLPAILTTGLLAERASGLLKNKRFKALSGTLLITYGIWTLPFIQSLIP
ncbi:sulfite exporter TauE/SafE family protein [Alkalimarinus sediminis]|uniref:Sulfite exporter TauE/SafE family protein n=1 Tax=Alkalimarinus sediminis TaxID=1632866 RepID=A0A9E8HTW2_9ALTE|nr:sulfite exporter TauE/SafE family protein [Alkalimarinus sediminis]UZW76436.1 sulfite exporter TauE/SafE family protein [Alkalimarinus sediminis]